MSLTLLLLLYQNIKTSNAQFKLHMCEPEPCCLERAQAARGFSQTASMLTYHLRTTHQLRKLTVNNVRGTSFCQSAHCPGTSGRRLQVRDARVTQRDLSAHCPTDQRTPRRRPGIPASQLELSLRSRCATSRRVSSSHEAQNVLTFLQLVSKLVYYCLFYLVYL